jgi:hypothetical protein
MKSSFDKAVRFVLRAEGGLVEHPADPGGLTKYGISKRTYPTLDIANLTEAEAIDIYYRDYWTAVGCDDLRYPLDIIVFDSAVNCGVSRVKKWLVSNPGYIELLFIRLKYYATLSSMKRRYVVFMPGWVMRVVNLYTELQKGTL